MAGRKKRNDMRQSRFDKHRDSLRLGTLVKTLCNIGSHFVGPIESAEAAASRRNDSWSSVRKTDNWSCQLAQRLVKTGGRLVKHARYYWMMLAEGHLTRRLFASMLRRILALPLPAG